MNEPLTSRAARDARNFGANLPTLDPSAGYVTTINTYELAPEEAGELLDLLAHATAETIRFVPGFVSANFHLSSDRRKIVNYAQWESYEALAAARNNPSVVAWMAAAARIAKSSSPISYKLRHSVLAQRVTIPLNPREE